MLSIQGLSYRIAGKLLLDTIDMQISHPQKVGLVGRNGSGKSSLFKLILKQSEPDSGLIQLNKGLRITTVAQETPSGDQTPLEFVIASDKERTQLLQQIEDCTDPENLGDLYERLLQIDAYTAEARAATVLKGLGFSEEAQNRPLSSFSGGYRMRVALAAALFQMPDLLMLDEPTNHLDLESTLWLEQFLKSFPNSVLLITHDREVMNSVVHRLYHVHHTKLTFYNGNYDFFEKTFHQKLMMAQAHNTKVEIQRKHMQDFVDRFKATASKAAQAQSRLKAISKLEFVPVLDEKEGFHFRFPDPEPLAPPIITYEKVQLGYGENLAVLVKLSGSIQPNDRIALLGANGNGKSTFAKFLGGDLRPQSGHSTASSKLRIGYFHQHQFEELPAQDTPFDYIQRLMPSALPTKVRAHIGRFGFSQEKSSVKIGVLSGGEKVRLVFAKMTALEPNLLILDEPTNHLDIQMREELARALNEFKGAVILISHDWHLLQLTVDQLWVVENRGVTSFKGTLEDYKQQILKGKG